LELADQTLERLRQVAPDHPRLPDAEAAIHLRRGEYEAAIACFDRVVANPPSPEEAFVAQANRASALERLKRYDEALDTYRRVLQLDPNDAWLWHNMSILLMDQGRLDEALEANTRALAIMDFGNARMIRERILAKQLGATTDATSE
jgi:tetratricopeptide (TPR) repeat protein